MQHELAVKKAMDRLRSKVFARLKAKVQEISNQKDADVVLKFDDGRAHVNVFPSPKSD